MAVDLKKLLQFNELLTRFRAVTREVNIAGDTRKENDAEHSFGIAMFAWFIVSGQKNNLNQEKVIRYALAHDIVEAYAGDAFFYSTYVDEKVRSEKKRKEAEAQKRLLAEFPEFGDMHKTISDYEKREDPESRFVYALDKILPILNIYQAGGTTWREHGVTLEMLLTAKREKVALDPDIEKYFKEIEVLLRPKEKELFGTK